MASTVIRVIRDEGLIGRGRRMADLLAEGMGDIQARSGRIADLRWRGPMMAVELHDDARAGFTTRLHRDLVRHGYILAQRPGLNVLRLDPGVTIEQDDLEGFLDALAGILALGR